MGSVGKKMCAAAALAALVLAACSGDDDGEADTAGGEVTVSAIAAATEAGETAAIEGRRSGDKQSGDVQGAFRAEPPTGWLNAPVFLPNGGVGYTELRILDGSLYVDRVVLAPDEAPEDLTVTDRVFARVADDPSWLERPAATLPLLGNVALAGPFEMLAYLEGLNAELGTSVEDDGLTRYDLTPIADIEAGALWIDDDTRLQRASITTATGTVEWDVTEYGVPVEIEAPPADQVTDVGLATGTAVTPDGDFVEVASGNNDGIDWALQRAPASDGGTCWAFVSTPALFAEDSQPQCISELTDDNAPPEFAIEFPFTTDGTGAGDAVVAVSTKPIDTAQFALADGTELPATSLDGDDDATAVVWVGPTEPPVGALVLTASDGTEFACGPGTITGPGDLSAIDEAVLAEERTFPWTCNATE